MNDIPRKELKKLIERFGISLSEDRLRCLGMLKDVCGEHKKEIAGIMSALDEGIPNEILKPDFSIDISRRLLSRRLEDNRGISEELAVWAVDTWAIALKIIKDETDVQTVVQVQPSKTQPIKRIDNTAVPVPNLANIIAKNLPLSIKQYFESAYSRILPVYNFYVRLDQDDAILDQNTDLFNSAETRKLEDQIKEMNQSDSKKFMDTQIRKKLGLQYRPHKIDSLDGVTFVEKSSPTLLTIIPSLAPVYNRAKLEKHRAEVRQYRRTSDIVRIEQNLLDIYLVRRRNISTNNVHERLLELYQKNDNLGLVDFYEEMTKMFGESKALELVSNPNPKEFLNILYNQAIDYAKRLGSQNPEKYIQKLLRVVIPAGSEQLTLKIIKQVLDRLDRDFYEQVIVLRREYENI